jgi:hypothetical protein
MSCETEKEVSVSKLRFQATLDLKAWRDCGITAKDDLILLRYPYEAKPRIRTELQKISEKNIENDKKCVDPVELDVEISIHYRPRSIQANKLMWELYFIISEIINAESKDMKRVTPESLYEIDMQDWAPRHIITCNSSSFEFFKIILLEEKGKIKRTTWNEALSVWEIEIWQTSSYWNTVQQSEHIERLLSQVETMGRNRNNNGDVAAIYKDFKAWEKKRKW